MTEQQKNTLLQLRDEAMYYARRAQEAQEKAQLLMLQLGLPALEISVKDTGDVAPSPLAR